MNEDERSIAADTASTPREAADAGRRGGRRGTSAIAAILVVAALVWLGSARAVNTTQGVGTGTEYVAGQRLHVGQMGMVNKDIVVLWARPRVVGSAQVELRVCRRGGDPLDGAIGSLSGDAEIEGLCPELEPLHRGVHLAAEAPQGDSFDYVLVSLLSSTPDESAFYCGLDLVYRAGNRLGFARQAGSTNAVVHAKGQPFIDESGETSALPLAEQDDPC